MTLFRKFLDSQLWLSRKFDEKILPADMSTVGFRVFFRQVVPSHIQGNQKIYDIGSGKRPVSQWFPDHISKDTLHMVGIDIDADELAKAPAGAYAEAIVGDICTYRGRQDGDVAICGCLLEHVKDMRAALQGVTSTLKPGGTLLIFIPNRNALFTRLNMLLPEKLKRKILNILYPEKESAFIGFPAYYDRCTPDEMRMLLRELNIEVTDEQYYHYSNYFMFLAPAHILWRLYQLLLLKIAGKAAASENFILVGRKK